MIELASKYDCIGEYLAKVKKDKATLFYSEMNNLIQRLSPEKPLPPSAYKFENWWGNDQKSHTQSRSWLSVGWKTDMSRSELGKFIVFVRATANTRRNSYE
ncbi:DUF7662 domain-containing protein [Saccharibacillus deserti]|uniref:DUF7662 domain-containing protein n=1 Tax=Saccharibacillus deserti TaxID=1634444 RepID=UPI003CCCFD28